MFFNMSPSEAVAFGARWAAFQDESPGGQRRCAWKAAYPPNAFSHEESDNAFQ
jgi:hypothetical protein